MFGVGAAGAAVVIAAILYGQVNNQGFEGEDFPAVELPIVEQRVEAISVAHLDDGVELVFFWAFVQGEWTCLDHRWIASGMVVSCDPAADEWLLQWPDGSDGWPDACYRMIRSPLWIESRETVSPLAEQNQRPWFRQLLNPGLKQPPKMAAN